MKATYKIEYNGHGTWYVMRGERYERIANSFRTQAKAQEWVRMMTGEGIKRNKNDS